MCSLINYLSILVIFSSSISSSIVSSFTIDAFNAWSTIGDDIIRLAGETPPPLLGDPDFAASTVALNPESIACF